MNAELLEHVDIFRAEAYPVIDSWCADAVAKLGTGCRDGCSYCCRNLTTMTLIEAMVILRSPVGRAAFESKVKHVVELASKFIRRDPDTTLAKWRKRNERCIFLGACERCVVYDVRPFNCRTHIAAKPCEEDQAGNLYIDPADGVMLSMVACQEAERIAGVPFVMAPAPVALLLAADIMRNGLDDVRRRFDGTPFLDPFKSLGFWAYIELED
jgi:Fe-S-cluster containining protein